MVCIALPCNLWYKRNKFHYKKITCNKNKSNLKRCLNGERLGIWLTQFRNKRFLPHNKHVRFSLSFYKNNEIILRGKNLERLFISSSAFVGNRMFICLCLIYCQFLSINEASSKVLYFFILKLTLMKNRSKLKKNVFILLDNNNKPCWIIISFFTFFISIFKILL